MGADKTCHLWQVIFFVQILYTNIRNRNRNPEVVNHKPQSDPFVDGFCRLLSKERGDRKNRNQKSDFKRRIIGEIDK